MYQFRRICIVLIAVLLSVPAACPEHGSGCDAGRSALCSFGRQSKTNDAAAAGTCRAFRASRARRNCPSDTPPDSNSAQQAPPGAPQVSEGSGTTSNSDASDAPSTRNDSTFVLNVNEVPVVFTVTDKHNHYVRDLSKKDFKVIDDGRPVNEIRSFRRETDLPLRVGLLIDSSASVRGRFKFEQEAAIEFINQTIRPKYDQAFVLGFDSSLEVTQEFTGNSELLSKGIRSLRPGNSTRLYDAIFYACRERLLNTSEPMSVRKP